MTKSTKATSPSGGREKVKESARKLRDKASDIASGAGEKAREEAAGLAEAARQTARDAAAQAREQAAGRVETAAEAVEAARGKVPEGSLEERALDRLRRHPRRFRCDLGHEP